MKRADGEVQLMRLDGSKIVSQQAGQASWVDSCDGLTDQYNEGRLKADVYRYSMLS